jgi:HSP20 family molecular chaperone IbpA
MEEDMGFIPRDAFARSGWAGNRSLPLESGALESRPLESKLARPGGSPIQEPKVVALRETAQGIEIRADLPGIGRDQVEIALGEREVTIRCRRYISRRASLRWDGDRPTERITESVYDAVAESIRLPFPVARHATTVTFVDGRLRILAPRQRASIGSNTRIRYGDNPR